MNGVIRCIIEKVFCKFGYVKISSMLHFFINNKNGWRKKLLKTELNNVFLQ